MIRKTSTGWCGHGTVEDRPWHDAFVGAPDWCLTAHSRLAVPEDDLAAVLAWGCLAGQWFAVGAGGVLAGLVSRVDR